MAKQLFYGDRIASVLLLGISPEKSPHAAAEVDEKDKLVI